jgi:hypothetical protein
MDEQRRAAAQKLLDAAYDFWSACQAEGQHGAVQWLIGTGGEMVVFTRGEYRDALMHNIWSLEDQGRAHVFEGEEIPKPEEDEQPCSV